MLKSWNSWVETCIAVLGHAASGRRVGYIARCLSDGLSNGLSDNADDCDAHLKPLKHATIGRSTRAWTLLRRSSGDPPRVRRNGSAKRYAHAYRSDQASHQVRPRTVPPPILLLLAPDRAVASPRVSSQIGRNTATAAEAIAVHHTGTALSRPPGPSRLFPLRRPSPKKTWSLALLHITQNEISQKQHGCAHVNHTRNVEVICVTA